MSNQTLRAFFLLCLLPSTIFAADIRDLVSASNDFEVAMIEHVQVLERTPSATELAASLRAEIEFYRVQKVEDQFHRDFDGLDST